MIKYNLAELTAEFEANPIGHHSPALRHLLQKLRSSPTKGKFVLVCTKPYREWVLATLTGSRKNPVKLNKRYVFNDLLEAERFVFRRRLKAFTRLEEDQ
tara:strand:- start:918 stop:1214 length:297 start_codon:yes stop_codon:yes gene_type:complete